MSAKPKVSVIVVNFNSLPHVDVCLDSLMKQTYANYEVVFVDNGSTDGSLEHARTQYPSLVFVPTNANLGYACGVNAGLAHATGELIAPLNIDTEVAPTWLAVMVEGLTADPRIGAVTPKILLFDDRGRINAKGHNVHVSGLSFCRGLYRADDGSVAPERVSGVSGCSYLVRRETLERMGGVPGADSFMSNDDVVLSWLLHLMGYEVRCLPEAIVFHRYRLKMDPGKLHRLEKDRARLVLSTLDPLTLVLGSPGLIAVEFMVLAYSVVRGPAYAKAKLSAWSALWRERRRIGEARRQRRALRRATDWHLLRSLRWGLEWRQLFQIAG